MHMYIIRLYWHNYAVICYTIVETHLSVWQLVTQSVSSIHLSVIQSVCVLASELSDISYSFAYTHTHIYLNNFAVISI